jgi:hypothetical protein
MGRGRDHRGGCPRALLHRPARRADATVSVEDPAPLARARPVGLGVGRHRAAGGVPGGAPGRPGAGEAGRAVCAVRLRRVVQRQVRLHGGRTLVIPVSPSANTSPETTCSSSSSPALRRQTASPFSTRRKSALKTTTLAKLVVRVLCVPRTHEHVLHQLGCAPAVWTFVPDACRCSRHRRIALVCFG